MKETLLASGYFGIVLTLGIYLLASHLKRYIKSGLFNPLLITTLSVMGILFLFRIDYETYNLGGQYIHYFLTPTTICLAIPLYKQLSVLKEQPIAILAGILSGVAASAAAILAFSLLFRFDHVTYVSMLPKSITTAIGIGVAEELGGIPAITIASIMVTGIFGNIIAEGVCRLFKITDPVAVGLAIGTSSHAMGTSKALELGEVQGAMSSLAIAVSGLMTVVVAPMMAGFI